MRRKQREREMRGRTRDRADEEARHHANARDQPPGHEGAAKRDPEAEDLGDGRDVGVREALVLEERHRHRARDVARHAEARDEQQDRDCHRAEPLEELWGSMSEGGSGASSVATIPTSIRAAMHR